MSNREDLNNIDHDLGKLHTYVAEYIKQVVGNSYLGTQQFKGTLDRILIPYTDTQLDFIKSGFENDVREPMLAYWILKLLGQNNTPQKEDIQDELDTLNQLLYKPGKIVPGIHQDNIVVNGYDFTNLVSLLTKIKLFRYLVENHTVIKNYIDNNKESIDRDYPELNTQTIDWLKNEFAKIRDVAVKPNDHVTYPYGRAPAHLKALPALKIPAPVRVEARPEPVRPAPYIPPRVPYVAPYVPPYVPPRAPYVAPPRPLSNWQAFISAHHNTSLSERFSFHRLFRNNGIFDVTTNASIIPFAFYNLLFWLQIPLLIDIIKDIASSCFESLIDNMLYIVGRGNYFDFVRNALQTSFTLAKVIFSPLLLAGPFVLGLTSLPITILNGFVENVLNLPRLVAGTISLGLRLVDLAKDVALIGAGLYFFSNFLGSFAFAPQVLANVGLTALAPFVSAPFGALALTVGATALLLPPVTMIALATARTCNNMMSAMFSGVGKIFRFNHSSEREIAYEPNAGERLGRYFAHPRRAERQEMDVPAREVRFGRRNVRPRAEEIAEEDARPVRRIRVR